MMGKRMSNDPDRVRANTSPQTLKKIDGGIEEKIRYYAVQPRDLISRRISELEQEWDIERLLETNASGLALLGLVLGFTRGRTWFALSAGVMGFLLLHGVQGWCPPVPLLRRLGVRTRSEIDREKFALKVLRGDFQSVSAMPEEVRHNPAEEIIQAVKG
jgi:hypothetical protein